MAVKCCATFHLRVVVMEPRVTLMTCFMEMGARQGLTAQRRGHLLSPRTTRLSAVMDSKLNALQLAARVLPSSQLRTLRPSLVFCPP